MSIIGAVKAGSIIGDVAKDAIFNYTKKQYTDKISELSALISRLNKHLSELENLRAEVGSFWNDAGSSAAIANLDNTIRATRNKTEEAQELMTVFEKTVAEMDQSQSGLDAALEMAKTILSVLGA